ncbi:MAG TPA: DcrB-related protein [Vineibacter sp.]|nr:DcrB-related protein [Vineibacter sp.]
MSQFCRQPEFSFQLPDDWISRTVISWSASPAAGYRVTPNVVVAYDKPRPGEDLDTYANRQLKDLSASAQQFHLDLRRHVVLGGRPAIEVIFHWQNGDSIHKQQQIYNLLPDGRVVLIANLASSGDFPAVEPLFRNILGSFVWTDGGPSPSVG